MLPLRVPTPAWSSSLRSSSASKALATPHCSQAGGGRLAATACGESEERTLMDSGLSSCASLACMALFVAAFGVDAVSRACNILATWLEARAERHRDRKSTRLNSSHLVISYAVFCLKKKKKVCTILLVYPHAANALVLALRIVRRHSHALYSAALDATSDRTATQIHAVVTHVSTDA